MRPAPTERPVAGAIGPARPRAISGDGRAGQGLKGRILLHLIYIETTRRGCYDGSEMGADEDDEQRGIQCPVLDWLR